MKSTRIVYVDWNSGRLALKVSDLLSMRNRSEIGGESAECRVQTERSQPITRESYRGPQLTFPQQAQPATPNISGDETGPGIPQETSKVRILFPMLPPACFRVPATFVFSNRRKTRKVLTTVTYQAAGDHRSREMP